MSNRVAIIGAGGTGRGFIPRLLQEDNISFDLFDKDPVLIKALQKASSYIIEVGEDSHPVHIGGYRAFHTDDAAAAGILSEAEIIFTSVGEDHLSELIPLLKRAADLSTEPLRIVVCENGVSPKLVLRKAIEEAGFNGQALVTQGVIFCTSIPKQGTVLDIVSENYPELPVDMDENLFPVPYPHFIGTKQFGQVLQRKIYTYNCLSACISYLGACQGYTIYSDAANDDTVKQYCDRLSVVLNRSLCMEMQLEEKDQEAFADRALRKFRNPLISDTIQKNSRAVMRKLSPSERVMGPMQIMLKHHQDPFVMEVVSAAALLYFDRNEKSGADIDDLQMLKELNPQLSEEQIGRIGRYYKVLINPDALKDLLDAHEEQS